MKLQVDPGNGVPLHAQVEKLLRKMVEAESDRWVSGENFPREVELALQLGIARNTVRQAISKLVQEGLLVRKKGVGTRVAHGKIYTRLDQWFSFTHEMASKGLKISNHLQEAIMVSAGAEVASAMDIRERSQVLRLTRLRGGEDPYLLSISWFHPRFGISTEIDFSRPLYTLLEEYYSIYVSVSREEISALSADQMLAEALQIGLGAPVLYRMRKVFNSDGLLVEYNKVYYRGDGMSYALEIGRM